MGFLSGWKTYIVAAGAIIAAVGAYLSGTMDLTHLVEAIFVAIQSMNIRHALTTTVSDATNKKL